MMTAAEVTKAIQTARAAKEAARLALRKFRLECRHGPTISTRVNGAPVEVLCLDCGRHWHAYTLEDKPIAPDVSNEVFDLEFKRSLELDREFE